MIGCCRVVLVRDSFCSEAVKKYCTAIPEKGGKSDGTQDLLKDDTIANRLKRTKIDGQNMDDSQPKRFKAAHVQPAIAVPTKQLELASAKSQSTGI